VQHSTAATVLLVSAALLATGSTLAQSSSNPQAQQFFQQASQAHPEGDAQEAIDLYRKAIEADPQFVEAYLKLGELLVVLDRFDEARTVFQKAKEVAPRRGDVRAWLVYVLFNLGDYSTAVEEGQNARTFVTPGGLATVGYYVGLAHERLGSLEEAARWLNEAASIEAGGFSGLAETALIEVYQRMVTQRRDPELTLKVAVPLYQRERYTEALTALQALTTDTAQARPLLLLAWPGQYSHRRGLHQPCGAPPVSAGRPPGPRKLSGADAKCAVCG
jgi:tetratricopeptide (TPR) repeat protein